MDDDLICRACNQMFLTRQARNSHQKQKQTCKWYKRGKLPANRDKEVQPAELEDERVRTTRASKRRRISRREDGGSGVPADVDMQQEDLEEMREREDHPDKPIQDVAMQPPPSQAEIGEAGPGPQTEAYRARRYEQRVLEDDNDERVVEEDLEAGAVIRMADPLYERWKRHFTGESSSNANNQDSEDVSMVDGSKPSNHFHPFASELDYKIADWMVQNNPGHNAFDRLLAIPGVVERLGLSYRNTRGMQHVIDEIPERSGKWKDTNLNFSDNPDEVFIVRHRDPLEAVRSLWGDPTLSKHIVYRPKKIFSTKERDSRIYNEMWTGHWWQQVQTKLPKGSTVAAVILSTDKTQLTQFSGGKSAYPVYLTLGNIPRAIRRKPSMHACVLVGYLSVDALDETDHTEDDLRARVQRLFHQSMRVILEPLRRAGKEGVEMVGGDGSVRRVHPILACYAADYPEQRLVTCTKYGTCPKCRCPHDMLQDSTPSLTRSQKWTLKVIEEGLEEQRRCRRKGMATFHAYCKRRDVTGGAFQPFWAGFPYCDIHLATTPDVLHQLYQGVFTHLVKWCRRLVTDKQLDARLKCLPYGYGVRHFKKGWSVLSQISGPECKQMAKVLLGCLVGIIPHRGILAVRSLLDFIYLAQYSTHDTVTLHYMQDALDTFNANKRFFTDVGIRAHFNIPKFHSMMHYVQSIKLFGTTDNYNTEMFERLHIDYSKDGFRASNKRDEFPQMIRYLTRREKMQGFSGYLAHFATPNHQPEEIQDTPPLDSGPTLGDGSGEYLPQTEYIIGPVTYSIAKWPNFPRQSVSKIAEKHCAPDFDNAIKVFLNSFLFRPESMQHLAYRDNPVERVDVFCQFKLGNRTDEDEAFAPPEADVIKANQKLNQYDTVIVMVREDAESTGLQGTRVGRVRVIFRLPRFLHGFPVPVKWPKVPLAYIEWYSPLERTPQHNSHLMYKIKKTNPTRGAIVPITDIRQSCMLFPMFSKYADSEISTWTTENVLDKCSQFLVNNWSSKSAYKTIY